ncbi:MAG: protein arginine kinase [Lentisphaeria bacterium]|nr:protein arginine kinase [Lentisphaeria bacterium]
MSSPIDDLFSLPVSFLDNAPGEIALSTRIRLARNLAGLPFPNAASQEEKCDICDKITAAVNDGHILDFGKKHREFDLAQLSDIDRNVLLERRLASAEFIAPPLEGKRLLVCPLERCSIMVNEEDQIRMQSIRPGFQLQEVYEEINAIDDALSEQLEFAFDNQLGFLTSCPTNAGTGMRASVMLHLPALVLSGQILPTIQGINKLHLAVRGIFGEGTDNRGNLFQISNQYTLGESEAKTIASLDAVITQLILHEKQARKNLLQRDRFTLLDNIGRAYGILRHSYKLSSAETLQSLSFVRMGVDMGFFASIDIKAVNELFIAIGSAHLQKSAGRSLSDTERDISRAELCRQKLK